MLLARRQFLAAGHYQPLSGAINTLIAEQLHERHEETRILDAGCGEGYYLARLQRHLQRIIGNACTVYGLDVSKVAVRMAAKQHKNACFFVADLKQRIHVPNQSIHVLFNIFAPRNVHEFVRVLAAHGVLLTVIPAPKHLLEVRQQLGLLQLEQGKQQRVVDQLKFAFVLKHITTLTYPLHLHKDALEQIITMTPNYWHQCASGPEHIDQIDTCAAFTMLLFERKG